MYLLSESHIEDSPVYLLTFTACLSHFTAFITHFIVTCSIGICEWINLYSVSLYHVHVPKREITHVVITFGSTVHTAFSLYLIVMKCIYVFNVKSFLILVWNMTALCLTQHSILLFSYTDCHIAWDSYQRLWVGIICMCYELHTRQQLKDEINISNHSLSLTF